MNRGLLGAFAAVFLLGQGIRLAAPQETVPPPGNNSPRTLTPTRPPGPSASSTDSDGPWKTSCDYFAAIRVPKPSPLATPFDQQWCLSKDLRPSVLIATIPDPKRTHLALYFDRTLESIIGAAGDANFEFDRYWLPWDADDENGKNENKDLLLLKDRKRQQEELEATHQQPGLLIFRGKPDSLGTQAHEPKALFVLLVAEEPTSGVNKSALLNAVQYSWKLSSQKKIFMVGPNFSGSLQSLAFDLKNIFNGAQFDGLIASGVATSTDASCRFRALLGEQPTPKYAQLVEDDSRSQRLFLDYVRQRWSSSSDIAILSEAGTEYGSAISPQSEAGSPQKEAQKQAQKTSPSCLVSDPDPQPLVIRYPREIARLRNAFQEETDLVPAAKDPAGVDHGVKLTLKDGNSEARDNVEAFSPFQSPASQQSILAAISRTLRRDRVHLTGIVATDVLDAVFLSRYLQLSAPDTRLFMLDADLLFSREVENAPLTGMLSITTYPLFIRAQRWTMGTSAEPLVQFASRYAEGTYNACVYILNQSPFKGHGKLADYTRPFPQLGRTSGEQDRPPLWLTVLGRDELLARGAARRARSAE